jgi:predicted metal-dependent peptidase
VTAPASIPPELDRAKVAAARLWAASAYPYLASALFASPVVAQDGLGGVRVDEWWRMYVDPAAVEGWTAPELGRQFVHHVGHLLRDHADRARSMGLRTEERSQWVDAADAEINDDLPLDQQPPADPVRPADLGCEEGLFAEEYFRLGEARAGEGHDCGSGAHGEPEPWEQDPPAGSDDGVDRDQAELLRRKVAADALAHEREHGTLPEGLRRWAERLVGSRVDWRRELAAELRRGVAAVAGAVDYSYARPSRRAAVAGDVILPAMRRPSPEVAVVCDTSASITDELLGHALAEVDGVLEAVGLRSVRVVVCDAAVHAVERIARAGQLAGHLLGGGGTDMAAGLAAAVERPPRPQVVVVLTDGYTPWPDRAPAGVRVVVALLGEHPGPAPDWATAVRVAGSAATAA